MLKKVGALAAGVAASGLLRPTKARANNGDPMIFGSTSIGTGGNNATSPSRFAYNGGATTNTALFLFEDGTSYDNTSTRPAVLNGWANGAGPGGAKSGVYGYTENRMGAGVIGEGNAAIGIGVKGIGGIGGTGCYGNSDGDPDSYGVAGTSNFGVGGSFGGGRAALFLDLGGNPAPDPNVTNPIGGGGGDVYRGSTNGSLWYRTGGPGSYRRVADDTTAGALTPFAASSRFVNLDPLGAGATHAYQIGGMTVTGNTVPAKARAIIGRISDANPTGGGGALLVSAINPPPAGTGVIPVNAGAPLNSFFFSALDATGKLYVRNSSPSGSTNVIIDVGGYYE